MGDIRAKLTRDAPGVCPECGQPEVRHVNARLCDVCATIAYLIFRHAMNWPLDDADKKRLGLV